MQSGEREVLVKIDQLSKRYHGDWAVKDVSFQIKRGSCIALLGPNGAGKTTTLHMLAGLLEESQGTIHFHNKQKDFRKSIGFLPQQPQLFGWMTAEEFLHVCGQLSELPKANRAGRLDEVLQFVGLSNVKKKKIASFSGGMKQRLGLAQAILHEPELLILDEPVSALDPTGRREVLELIREMKKKMTILFSTHILHDAEQVCDQVLILKKGDLKWNGELEQLRSSMEKWTIQIKTKTSMQGVFHTGEGIINVEEVSTNEVHLHVEKGFDANSCWRRLLEMGMDVEYFNANPVTLEQAYLEVLQK